MSLETPIRRSESLKPFSHDHHHGLLLCWKIRTGLTKGIDTERIAEYTRWFYHKHLIPHFDLEEKIIFPILGNEHELVKRAITEHRRLRRLFEEEANLFRSLSLIEEELESHIRFEERVLFNEVQKISTSGQLKSINELHSSEAFIDNLEDPFWEK